MGSKICQHPPCDRPARTAGWCYAHYQRIRSGKDMDAPKMPRKQDLPCRQDGCDLLARGGGYRGTHYSRLRAGRDMSLPIRRKSICKAAGCDHTAQSKGYCGTHYSRFKHGRDIDAPIPHREKNQGEICRQDGCDGLAATKGWCNAHYLRARKGSPMDLPVREFAKIKIGPCSWPDCEREISTAGLCKLHYQRKQEGRDMDAPVRAPRISRVGLEHMVRKDGYVEVKRLEHFGNGRAGKFGWFYEHRYVMEAYLGRRLHDGENVHHINGDRTDNRLDNLELWTISQPTGQRVIDLVEWAYALRQRISTTEPSSWGSKSLWR